MDNTDLSGSGSGWTINGSPTITPTALGAERDEGYGNYVAIVDATGATTDGIQQTLLKVCTRGF